MADCEECASLSATYRHLAAAFKRHAEDLPGLHPSSQEIVTYALSPSEYPLEDLARIATHLRSCPRCSSEVGTVRQAESESTRRISPFSKAWFGAISASGRPGLGAIAAAAIVVLLLGYPAFRGIHELPRVKHRAERLQAESERLASDSAKKQMQLQSEFNRRLEEAQREASPSGPVRLDFLTGTTRGGSPAGTPRIHPEGETIFFAVTANPRALPHGEERCRIEILAGESVSWVSEISAARIRQDLDSPEGSVVLAVPAAALRPGSYQMRLTCAFDALAKPLLQIPFQIVQ